MSLLNLEEMMAERGMLFDHATVQRWSLKIEALAVANATEFGLARDRLNVVVCADVIATAEAAGTGQGDHHVLHGHPPLCKWMWR